MFKKALVSVSDKNGLVDFLRPLAKNGLQILSTGGTAKHLREAGLQVQDVSDYTGHPEVLEGRVKTLHPKVHMALLARADHPQDQAEMNLANLTGIDLVIGNLYPFAETENKFSEGQATIEELIENIDIGGPSFLRAAAKNHKFVTVICDPADYAFISAPTTLEQRQSLAYKVFAHTARYDSMIALTLGGAFQKEASMGGLEVLPLRYGENPHQKAAWYAEFSKRGLHTAQVLQGKPLSYNNILDLDAALNLCCELKIQLKHKNLVAIKHNNPCGVAVGAQSLNLVTQRMLQSDPVSVFGGVVCSSEVIDSASAKILADIFLECIVAPDYEPDALKIFSTKKNLRILRYPKMFSDHLLGRKRPDIKSVLGGFVQQDSDRNFAGFEEWIWPEDLSVKDLSAEQKLDLHMGEIVCASLKSNAIAIVSNGQVLGLGMGQVNRVDAVKLALDRAQRLHPESSEWILISDAFFPFADSIELIATSKNVKMILQPGGSMRDEEVQKAAQKYKIPMILSGVRHFRH